MAKAKQKDFAKVKLKVGRKLKPSNSTNTEFKSKKVVVRTTRDISSDPVHALTVSAAAAPAIKLMHMSKLMSSSILTSAPRITGDLIHALARLSLDSDHKVRIQARQCIDQALTCISTETSALRNCVSLILPHVTCGLTHLNAGIVAESRALVSALVARSSPDQENKFMRVIGTRLWDQKSLLLSDLELFAKVVHRFYHKAADQRQLDINPVTNWDPKNSHIPWSRLKSVRLSVSVDVTFSPAADASDDRQDVIATLKTLSEKGLSEFAQRLGSCSNISMEEARRLIALITISNCLKGQQVNLPHFEVLGEGNKKKKCYSLSREIRDLVNRSAGHRE